MSNEEVVVAPKPSPNKMVAKKADLQTHDPDRLLATAKKLVVDNYNGYRDKAKSKELTVDGVYIVWFAKTLGNWKAIIASPVVRGLLWEVTFNGHRQEVYLDVYRKTNNVKISLNEGTAA